MIGWLFEGFLVLLIVSAFCSVGWGGRIAMISFALLVAFIVGGVSGAYDGHTSTSMSTSTSDATRCADRYGMGTDAYKACGQYGRDAGDAISRLHEQLRQPGRW